MYDWHTSSLPVASFDGQVFVDDKNLVWRWDAAVGAWLRAEQMYVKETARFWIEASRRDVGTPITRMFNGRPRNQWDDFFNLTFCELRTAVSGQVLFRAQMTMAELETWVLSVLNTGGGPPQYLENAEVIVREVVDPTVRCSRIEVWKSVYSSARGKSAYNRRWGREIVGLPNSFQSTHRWRGSAPGGYWTDGFTEPGRDFMQAFHGISTPVDPNASDRMIWFHADHRNLYHQPSVGSLVNCQTNQRGVYDANDGTYKDTPGAFTVGAPRVFWRTMLNTNRVLDTPSDCVKGTDFLRKAVCGVMVYPLTSGRMYAFYVKPLGVDRMSMSFDSTPAHQIVAVGHYGDSQETSRRAPAGQWNGSDSLSFRFCLFNAVPQPDSQFDRCLDVANSLRKMSFYARNTTTGVVSEPFATEIVNVRRKANISMSFEPRRAG